MLHFLTCFCTRDVNRTRDRKVCIPFISRFLSFSYTNPRIVSFSSFMLITVVICAYYRSQQLQQSWGFHLKLFDAGIPPKFRQTRNWDFSKERSGSSLTKFATLSTDLVNELEQNMLSYGVMCKHQFGYCQWMTPNKSTPYFTQTLLYNLAVGLRP